MPPKNKNKNSGSGGGGGKKSRGQKRGTTSTAAASKNKASKEAGTRQVETAAQGSGSAQSNDVPQTNNSESSFNTQAQFLDTAGLGSSQGRILDVKNTNLAGNIAAPNASNPEQAVDRDRTSSPSAESNQAESTNQVGDTTRANNPDQGNDRELAIKSPVESNQDESTNPISDVNEAERRTWEAQGESSPEQAPGATTFPAVGVLPPPSLANPNFERDAVIYTSDYREAHYEYDLPARLQSTPVRDEQSSSQWPSQIVEHNVGQRSGDGQELVEKDKGAFAMGDDTSPELGKESNEPSPPTPIPNIHQNVASSSRELVHRPGFVKRTLSSLHTDDSGVNLGEDQHYEGQGKGKEPEKRNDSLKRLKERKYE